MRVDPRTLGATLLGFLLSTTTVAADADDYTLLRRAYAYAPQSDTLLYTEEHRETWQNGTMQQSTVRYFAPDKRLLAEKNIDFRKHRTAPDFMLNDFRDGYQEGATWLGGQVEVIARRNARQSVSQSRLDVPRPVVVDGGFNEFVLANWEALNSGKRLQFHFVAPIEQDYFTFTIKRKRVLDVDGRAHMQLEMKPESSLVRLFVAPVTLTYDIDARHLLKFEGMTNLNDDKGKSVVARLVYPREEVKKEAVSMRSALTDLTMP